MGSGHRDSKTRLPPNHVPAAPQVYDSLGTGTPLEKSAHHCVDATHPQIAFAVYECRPLLGLVDKVAEEVRLRMVQPLNAAVRDNLFIGLQPVSVLYPC